MRTALFALIAIGGLSLAVADPPVAPASSAAAGPAPAASAAPPPPATPAATAQTPAPAPAKPVPDERMIAQQLRLQGYRLSMVRGEEKYCRREAPLGSRLESVMRCLTLQEAELMAKEGKETTERVQRNQVACLKPAQGGCGQ